MGKEKNEIPRGKIRGFSWTLFLTIKVTHAVKLRDREF